MHRGLAMCLSLLWLGVAGGCSSTGQTTAEESITERSEQGSASDSPAAATQARDPNKPVGYDSDRRVWLYDTDGDTYPDATEKLFETDPSDPFDVPGGIAMHVFSGFANATCRTGFKNPGINQIASRICIGEYKENAANYTNATVKCRTKFSHVCTHEDYMYLFLNTDADATYNTAGLWIGNMVGDDAALVGNYSIDTNNDPDIFNFEGQTNKADSRAYWCCHDDDG